MENGKLKMENATTRSTVNSQLSIPQLRFPEFSGEWEEKKLGDVAEIVGGGTPPTAVEKYWGGDIQWFTPTEIKNKYITNSKRTITQVGLDTSSARLLPKGTLLFSSRATVGEVGIAVQECTTNQGFQSFIVNKNNKPEFLYNWIIKNKKEFIRRASGSTFLEIGKSEIKKIKLNLPTKPEQQKIAAFLTAVDNKIEQLSKKQELLGEYKKGLMQQIFSQAIRFKDDDGSDFPDWEENKLSDVSDCLDNRRQPLNGAERNQMKGDIPYYGANGIVDYVNDYIFDEELVLLAEDGGNFNDFSSKPIAQKINGKAWVNNHAHILKARGVITTDFLFYSLVHKDIRRYIVGGGRAKLNKSDLLSIRIILPSLEEQSKIVNFLFSIDNKIEQVGEQLGESKQFKKALLQQMFV